MMRGILSINIDIVLQTGLIHSINEFLILKQKVGMMVTKVMIFIYAATLKSI